MAARIQDHATPRPTYLQVSTPTPEAAMTTPTTDAQPTFADSERGLLITVLVVVLLGVTAVLLTMS
jgi:hypothetical protein